MSVVAARAGPGVLALEAVTGDYHVPPEAAGKVLLMAQAWIEWAIRHGFFKP